jgi:hypothetical protein
MRMMARVAYYEADLATFFRADEQAVLGTLTLGHGFALEHEQKHAWVTQIRLLKTHIPINLSGSIYFEFSIPRMGKRVDAVLVIRGVVFVLEFKVGASSFDSYAIDQVYDYALDLKNFHRGSHNVPVLQILIATGAPSNSVPQLRWDADKVGKPICISTADLPGVIDLLLAEPAYPQIDAATWARSGYQPTPTIVEAALALYRQHDVKEITRSEAGADNLGKTALRVEQIIDDSKSNRRKSICFITGVPGAGKTLAGLHCFGSLEALFEEYQ